VGCNILLGDIPQSGRIFLLKERVVRPRDEVLLGWRRTLFLRDEHDLKSRRWLLDVMACVERLGRAEFSLGDIYMFEQDLQQRHPDNLHVKAKIRQQLQVLRDRGYLEFIEKGRYRLVEER
jgi:type II restriction enzyme